MRVCGGAGQFGSRVSFRQPGRDGMRRRLGLHTGIWRQRGHLTGGEGGFNLAQPPEVRQHLRREIDERGNRPGVRAFLSCPAQGLPHLPAGDGEL